MDDRESQKQSQEIAEWIQIRKEKGDGFMRGTTVEADLAPYRNTVIIDVGCGPRPFVEHFPARLGVMFDCCMGGYRKENLLQEETLNKVLCAEGMGEAMPFKDQSTDHIFAINMLDHTHSPEKVVEEFHRVLKPGGMVHLNVDIGGSPNVCEPVVFARGDIEQLFSRFHLVYEEEKPASNPEREAMLMRIFARSEGYDHTNPPPKPDDTPLPERTGTAVEDPAFLEILACPACRGDLSTSDAGFLCTACAAQYAVEQGIPLLTY